MGGPISTKFNLLISVVFLASALAACGGDEAINGDEPTPKPSATVASPTPGAGDGLPGGVVAIVDAARRNESAALEALMRYEPVPCTTTITGVGGPPRCDETEVDGTLVDVVFAADCEGYYARRGALGLGQISFGVFGHGDALYGVYAIDEASQIARAEPWAGASYAIVLNRIAPSDGTFVYVLLTDGEVIAGAAGGCGETPEQWVAKQGLGEPIFAP